MSIDYGPLWETLTALGKKKTDLLDLVTVRSGRNTGKRLSSATLAKLGKNEAVNLETLDSICRALDVPLDRVVRYVPD